MWDENYDQPDEISSLKLLMFLPSIATRIEYKRHNVHSDKVSVTEVMDLFQSSFIDVTISTQFSI